MAFSLKTLQNNIMKYFGNFYAYLLYGIYWGSVPAIVVYGLFSKPYSPIVLAAWGMLTGKEPEPDMYGGQPGMHGF
jgi:hypothetical protein